ncbi:MAG: primase-like DNA-binding domain-containing protein [Anaerolineae bacterium]
MDGLRDWQADRHWLAPEVQAATVAYRAEQDVLGDFLSECCELGPRFTVPVSALYEAYSLWCSGAGEEPVGKTRFGDSLKQRGLGQKRSDKGQRRWLGLRLI